jgi:peptidoglycan/xylan/chitin deacetylase (PgdA/CDA1 family)
MRRAIDAALAYSPLQPAMRLANSGRPRVLAYHGVHDVDRFERQIRYLAAMHVPVTLDAWLTAVRTGTPLPSGAVLVTFDDGDRSVLEKGLPVLREYGVPAVIFVIAGLLDTDVPFWWDEVDLLVRDGASAQGAEGTPEEMVRMLKRVPNARRLEILEELRAAAVLREVGSRQLESEELALLRDGGIEIGNHTLTHPCLDRCEDMDVEVEIERAHAILSRTCGSAPRVFAYPNGNLDHRAEAVLRRLGYEAAFLFDHRIGEFPPSNPMRTSRVRVNSTDPLSRFRILVSGLHSAVHRGLGRS